jgi:hypothetical protein
MRFACRSVAGMTERVDSRLRGNDIKERGNDKKALHFICHSGAGMTENLVSRLLAPKAFAFGDPNLTIYASLVVRSRE